jgi:hypothetical protein
MKLQPDGVSAELPAGQPRPLDGVLALLDPLLGGAALIVEGDDALGLLVRRRLFSVAAGVVALMPAWGRW